MTLVQPGSYIKHPAGLNKTSTQINTPCAEKCPFR